jgi:hypothetical protein
VVDSATQQAMYPTLLAVFHWLQANEAIAMWVEGIALVLIFGLDLAEYRRQGRERIKQEKESAAQLKIAEDAANAARDSARAAMRSADALIDSEKAFVMAELIPVCRSYGNQFHRPSGTGSWVPLNENEILSGYHLMHTLKFINMGRTPATILKFSIGHSYMDDNGRETPTGDTVQSIELPAFNRIIGGGDSTDAIEVNVKELRDSSIRTVGDSKRPIIFHGSFEYQHIFSDTEVIVGRFRYLYVPETYRLDRMSTSPPDKRQKTAD